MYMYLYNTYVYIFPFPNPYPRPLSLCPPAQDCPVRVFWDFCLRNSTLRRIDLRWNNIPSPLCAELQTQFHSYDRGKISLWSQLARNIDEQPYKMLL